MIYLTFFTSWDFWSQKLPKVNWPVWDNYLYQNPGISRVNLSRCLSISPESIRKPFKFFDVFREYRQATPDCNMLIFVINFGKLCIFYWQNERATGFGVALLLTLFGAHSQNPVLKTIAPSKLLIWVLQARIQDLIKHLRLSFLRN